MSAVLIYVFKFFIQRVAGLHALVRLVANIHPSAVHLFYFIYFFILFIYEYKVFI